MVRSSADRSAATAGVATSPATSSGAQRIAVLQDCGGGRTVDDRRVGVQPWLFTDRLSHLVGRIVNGFRTTNACIRRRSKYPRQRTTGGSARREWKHSGRRVYD